MVRKNKEEKEERSRGLPRARERIPKDPSE
jgi:hypothetical protein